jgi:hypothetical protein
MPGLMCLYSMYASMPRPPKNFRLSISGMTFFLYFQLINQQITPSALVPFTPPSQVMSLAYASP